MSEAGQRIQPIIHERTMRMNHGSMACVYSGWFMMHVVRIHDSLRPRDLKPHRVSTKGLRRTMLTLSVETQVASNDLYYKLTSRKFVTEEVHLSQCLN